MIHLADESKPRQKLQTLEVVRALAALAVVVFHSSQQPFMAGLCAELPPVFDLGKYGVPVFFVLSGFIIIFVHGREIGRPERVPRYFYRRWLRIWPLYAALTLLQVTVKPLMPGRESETLSQVITSLLFLDLGETPIINVGWTLVHEAFFYSVFGVVMIFGNRFVAWFLIVFLALQTGVHFDQSTAGPLASFVFSPMRWYFLVGIAVGCMTPVAFSPNSQGPRKIGLFVLLSVGLIGSVGALSPNFGKVSGWILLMAVLIGLVLLALVSHDLRKGVKMPRLLVYLGAASYSIYLVHSTVIDLGLVSLGKIAPVLLVNHLGVTMAVLALISVGCGLICHELLEKPLIRWFRSLRAEKV